MTLKTTDKILLVIEKNDKITEVLDNFHDLVCKEVNAVDILLVDKVINPMFVHFLLGNIPFIGHMFIANGIEKEDVMKCFHKRELTEDELIKLNLKNG